MTSQGEEGGEPPQGVVQEPSGTTPSTGEENDNRKADQTPPPSTMTDQATTAAPPASPSKQVAAVASSNSKAEQPGEQKSESVSATKTSTTTTEEGNKLFVVEEHHETEEVIERLLDVKGLEQSVTGLWGWMSGGVSKVAEKASQVAQQASQVAEKAEQQAKLVAEKAEQQAKLVAENARQQASIMAEKAAQAKALAAQQASELAATVSKTMEDKSTTETVISKPPSVIPAAALPWETAHPERRAEARERVLKLSMDDHTFTIPPPKEANFSYDAVAREPYAARMLDTDALLSAKRFKLVPKVVDEHDFWRNYFYRVDLILGGLGVPATPAESSVSSTPNSAAKKGPESTDSASATEAPNNPDWEEELRKEIAAAEASHVDDSVKEDENFDMLEDDLEFDDDGELEKSINDLKLG